MAFKPARLDFIIFLVMNLKKDSHWKIETVKSGWHEYPTTLAKSLTKQQRMGLDHEDESGKTPIVVALLEGDYGKAEIFVDLGFFDPKRVDSITGLTVLHHIAHITDMIFLNKMVNAFKSVLFLEDFKGNQPIHYACFQRNTNFVEILLKEGAKINCKNSEGNTPLHLACGGNDPKNDDSSKFEEFLIGQGANTNAKNSLGQIPAMLLFINREDDELILKDSKYDPISTLMKFNNTDLSIVDKFGRNLLHYACIRGATISVISLLGQSITAGKKAKISKKKINTELEDYSGTTPFGYAVKNNHQDLCIHLIQLGIEIPEFIPQFEYNQENELYKAKADNSMFISQQCWKNKEQFGILKENPDTTDKYL